ncbi:MAG TPA: DUF2726 domain-containing protein [Cellvibrio sp.]|nr:DUF2726 domain-containing protein [Cellvibrio sp.]
MFWAILILTLFVVAFGLAIYRIDKNAKAKYEKNFNPNEWQLPGHIELPAPVESQLKIQPQPQSSLPAANVKVTHETKPSVYSGAQCTFYKALEAALESEFALLTNINAADVIAVVASNTLATQAALNNLTGKQFAFVVCDKVQLTALCVIDFGCAVDVQLKAVCESARLPLMSFNALTDYDSPLLRAKILNAIGLKDSRAELNNESALDIVDEQPVNNLKDNGIDLVLCPDCSAVMLKRKAKNGENAGKLFWICSTYPKCRGMLPVK